MHAICTSHGIQIHTNAGIGSIQQLPSHWKGEDSQSTFPDHDLATADGCVPHVV